MNSLRLPASVLHCSIPLAALSYLWFLFTGDKFCMVSHAALGYAALLCFAFLLIREIRKPLLQPKVYIILGLLLCFAYQATLLVWYGVNGAPYGLLYGFTIIGLMPFLSIQWLRLEYKSEERLNFKRILALLPFGMLPLCLLFSLAAFVFDFFMFQTAALLQHLTQWLLLLGAIGAYFGFGPEFVARENNQGRLFMALAGGAFLVRWLDKSEPAYSLPYAVFIVCVGAMIYILAKAKPSSPGAPQSSQRIDPLP